MSQGVANRKHSKSINVASVTYGHSYYDDQLWNWLNEHAGWFDDHEYDMSDSYDYWRAWGLLSLAGCKVECYGYPDAPPPHECDWGEGVTITFEGDVRELIRRLNTMIHSNTKR